MRKPLETKLYRRNLIHGIKAWAVTLVRFSGLFFKGTGEEHSTNGPKNKKRLITMHKTLPSRDDAVRLYVPVKEGKEDSTSFKIASMHEYKTEKNTLKN